jgi:alpha-1,3-glucosyltransferase
MYGILLLSLILARSPTTRLAAGLLFAVLLCFKHIYLYLAPAYFVYLLRTYCLGPKFDLSRAILDIQLTNCIKLIIGVVGIFGSVFGPFIYWQQLPQLITRLFPFSRGLCHAYWAPNVWALYSFVDRVLIYVAPQLGLHVNSTAVNSVTRGLVGDTTFAVLPEVTPRATFLLTLVFQILPLVKLFVKPTFVNFIGAVTLCGYSSFLFGWHVHEKAILLVIFPFRYLSPHCFSLSAELQMFSVLIVVVSSPLKTANTSAHSVLSQSLDTSHSSLSFSRHPNSR